MKTLKRISALLLVLMLMASFSITAFAEDNYDDGKEIDSTIEENHGDNVTVTDYGTIWNNYGTVSENNGNVNVNAGTVSENNGKVDTNAGTVVNNNDGGAVNGNFGTIGAYTDDGKVDKTHGNFGTVSGNYLGANAGLTSNGNIIYNGPTGVIGDGEGYSHWELGNFSTVDINDGIIVTNGSGGEVKTNNEIITTNKGTVTENKSGGTIETNAKDGVVTTNTGNVETNQAGGTVTTNNGTVGKVDTVGNPVSGTGNYGKVDDNSGTVVVNQEGGTITDNNGTITENYGTVETNNGLIGDLTDESLGNNGTVKINGENGIIGGNQTNGVVETNKGTIGFNNGTVEDNYGSVDHNYSNVENNYDESRVFYNYGTVVNNSGTVYNSNEFGNGTVKNNFGDGKVYFIDASEGGGFITESSAQNQFTYNVDIKTENATASDKPTGDLVLFNDLYWLNDATTTGGSVTVTPKNGYTIKQVDLDSNVGTATKDGNGWKLNINKLTSSISLLIKGEKISTPAQSTAPVAVFTYKLSFDLDGGVMPDGKTELEMKCSSGQRIKLPEAPEKEGFVFAGWQTEIRGKTVILDAGAKFTVTAAKTFVALWEEA